MKSIKFNRKRVFWGLVVAAVLTISTAFVAAPGRNFLILKNMDIFYNLFREVNLWYVDEPDPEKLIQSSIDGMLETLDPYTNYITEEASENFKAITEGEYGGVGITLRNIDNEVTVIDVARNSPADHAGMKIGDRLKKVDGQWLSGKSDSEIFSLLIGTPTTKFKLTYLQAKNGAEVTKELTRAMVPIPNVLYFGLLDEANKIGYIRLANFSANAGKEVKDALLALKKQHGISSLVLDIRNNPGGLLIEAVDIVGLFVPRGSEVVSTHGRIQQWDNIYTTRHEPVDTTIALTIVANRQSASAAEIVAGAIQDMDRGVIVGQRTFGKGLVQTTRKLSYNTQVKITTAKYYIPSGRCIQALDYSHREADGSVGHIPDSLIRDFKTLKNKRIVRDGGGITPDVEAEPETLSNIGLTLYARHLLFKYALSYANKHDSIAPASKFEITDAEYDKFVAYLNTQFFDYQTEAEQTLAKLKTILQKNNDFDSLANEFNTLEAKLSHDRFKDLQIHRENVKDLLSEEITAHYYYNDGKIANTMRHDIQVGVAVAILRNPDAYKKLLTASSK